MSMPPPPPPYLNVIVSDIDTNDGNTHHFHSFDKFKPSIIIIVLILAITLLLSISLCILLRHLNRRCLRHLSTVATTVSTNTDPRPENPSLSILDSLPLFTFSSVTRRSSSGGDCAVCLSKFEPQDQLRLLPLCCHAFHALCIDTWLESNQTCPLCRSPINASESDVLKGIQASSAVVGDTDSFHLEIGSISRREAVTESGELQPRSFSLGSFDYIVEGDSDITMNQTYRRSVSDKEDIIADSVTLASEASLASEVGVGRSWLKDYVDRLSISLSSRTVSFRSSGRFFTGSSRWRDMAGVGDYDSEANGVDEEIGELFRWLSGV